MLFIQHAFAVKHNNGVWWSSAFFCISSVNSCGIVGRDSRHYYYRRRLMVYLWFSIRKGVKFYWWLKVRLLYFYWRHMYLVDCQKSSAISDSLVVIKSFDRPVLHVNPCLTIQKFMYAFLPTILVKSTITAVLLLPTLTSLNHKFHRLTNVL